MNQNVLEAKKAQVAKISEVLNNSKSGVVPPITRFEHNSILVAPPLYAEIADSTESTQTSNMYFDI